MIRAINNFVATPAFITAGLLFVFLTWVYTDGMNRIVQTFPPYRSSALVVQTAHGIPWRVVETRESSDFNGTWQVRVIDMTRGASICVLPDRPVEWIYRETTAPVFSASWNNYTGDDGDCLAEMRRRGGMFIIETLRTVRILGRNVNLPPVASAQFEVLPMRLRLGL